MGGSNSGEVGSLRKRVAELEAALEQAISQNGCRNEEGEPGEGAGECCPELVTHNNLLTTLLDHARACIAVMEGRDLRFTLVNKAYQALCPELPMPGLTYRDVFPEAADAGAEELLQEIIDTGVPREDFGYPAPIPGKPDATWDHQIARLPLAEGKEPALMVITWDSTEHSRAKRELEKHRSQLEELLSRRSTDLAISEKQFKFLFEHSPVGITMVDTEGRLMFLNPAIERMLGFTAEEKTGKSIIDWTHPEDRDTSLELINKLLGGQREFLEMEKRFVTKDGRVIWTNTKVALARNEGGEALFFVTMVEDITERKRIEKDLSDTVQLLERVYDSMDEAVLVISAATKKILSCNATAERMFGYKESELAGEYTRVLHPTEKGFRKFSDELFAALEAGETYHTEYKGKKKDGTIIPTEHVVKEIRDESGKRVLIVAVVRDISEKKNTERELRKNSKRLKELNSALNVLLDQREQEKKSMEESISGAVVTMVMPYLERIRKTGLDDLQSEYINILESNIREIIQPFSYRVSDKLMNLSPAETRVVSYIKQDRTNKEIASELNVSVRTVEYHRDNIRKKLGLKNRRVNLKTFLSNLK